MEIVSFFKNYWLHLFVFLVILPIAVSSLVISLQPKKNYTESLYNTTLNDATLTSTTKNELLYSYPINSGNGTNNGFFTIVVDGPFDIPNISYGVEDQLGRNILSKPPRVGKITIIEFEGKPDTTIANLMIFPKTNNIQLKSITVNLKR